MKKISKSELTSYLFCPNKYFLTYVKKIRQPTTEAMLSGTRMHNVFEKFFDVCFGVEPENWDKLIKTDELNDIEKRQVGFFLQQERFRFEELCKAGRERDYYPIMREKRLESDTLGLKGYIDRVDVLTKGKEVTLVEYKTGGKIDLTGIRRELSFYKLLWDDQRGADAGVATQFLLVNPKLETYHYMKAYGRSVKAVEKQIEKLRCALDNDDFPRKPHDRKCAACGMCRYVEELDLSNI